MDRSRDLFRRYRQPVWYYTSYTASILPWILIPFLYNWRWIGGHFAYNGEYGRAYHNNSEIIPTCYHTFNEKRLWPRTQFDDQWYFSKRCEGARDGTLDSQNPNFYRFVSGILMAPFSFVGSFFTTIWNSFWFHSASIVQLLWNIPRGINSTVMKTAGSLKDFLTQWPSLHNFGINAKDFFSSSFGDAFDTIRGFFTHWPKVNAAWAALAGMLSTIASKFGDILEYLYGLSVAHPVLFFTALFIVIIALTTLAYFAVQYLVDDAHPQAAEIRKLFQYAAISVGSLVMGWLAFVALAQAVGWMFGKLAKGNMESVGDVSGVESVSKPGSTGVLGGSSLPSSRASKATPTTSPLKAPTSKTAKTSTSTPVKVPTTTSTTTSTSTSTTTLKQPPTTTSTTTLTSTRTITRKTIRTSTLAADPTGLDSVSSTDIPHSTLSGSNVFAENFQGARDNIKSFQSTIKGWTDSAANQVDEVIYKLGGGSQSFSKLFGRWMSGISQAFEDLFSLLGDWASLATNKLYETVYTIAATFQPIIDFLSAGADWLFWTKAAFASGLGLVIAICLALLYLAIFEPETLVYALRNHRFNVNIPRIRGILSSVVVVCLALLPVLLGDYRSLPEFERPQFDSFTKAIVKGSDSIQNLLVGGIEKVRETGSNARSSIQDSSLSTRENFGDMDFSEGIASSLTKLWHLAQRVFPWLCLVAMVVFILYIFAPEDARFLNWTQEKFNIFVNWVNSDVPAIREYQNEDAEERRARLAWMNGRFGNTSIWTRIKQRCSAFWQSARAWLMAAVNWVDPRSLPLYYNRILTWARLNLDVYSMSLIGLLVVLAVGSVGILGYHPDWYSISDKSDQSDSVIEAAVKETKNLYVRLLTTAGDWYYAFTIISSNLLEQWFGFTISIPKGPFYIEERLRAAVGIPVIEKKGYFNWVSTLWDSVKAFAESEVYTVRGIDVMLISVWNGIGGVDMRLRQGRSWARHFFIVGTALVIWCYARIVMATFG